MEFCWNFIFQISKFFHKISDPYNITTQKFYSFLKPKKKMSKILKKLKKQIVNDGILKIFCI